MSGDQVLVIILLLAGWFWIWATRWRFTQAYETVAPGLARYVHDAIIANADAHMA